VVVVQRGQRVLPKEDPDLADALRQRLAVEGIEFLLDHTPLQAGRSDDGIRLQIKAGDGGVRWLEASHLLLATGRQANVEGLGLEAAGVQVTAGRILTDRRLRTSNKRIYACGDVAGPYPFTHMAEHQAGVILRNALLRLPATVEQRVIPWCTFTDPELARVGLSENEARAKGVPYKAYRFPFAEIDRAQAEDETAGFAKVVTTPRGRLLGAMILGPHAGELIHEYSLALSQRLSLSDISGVIHIYPTLAQVNRRVADQALKERLTPGAKKWMQRLFGLRGR
jgi:pyruvate/2-oxoglutarate dehydrogenase complex dihydrolipoamide dehydrogenase (E3) component